MLDRRAEMVPAYFALGMAVHDADRPRARALLRKAERLDPAGTRAPQIESELTVLEGQDLLARGIADEDLFQRALKLDPGNAEARTQLDRLAADSEVRQERTHRWAAGGALLFVALAGIILFGGRGRGKSTKKKSSDTAVDRAASPRPARHGALRQAPPATTPRGQRLAVASTGSC